jgi:hypothetical protein
VAFSSTLATFGYHPLWIRWHLHILHSLYGAGMYLQIGSSSDEGGRVLRDEHYGQDLLLAAASWLAPECHASGAWPHGAGHGSEASSGTKRLEAPVRNCGRRAARRRWSASGTLSCPPDGCRHLSIH